MDRKQNTGLIGRMTPGQNSERDGLFWWQNVGWRGGEGNEGTTNRKPEEEAVVVKLALEPVFCQGGGEEGASFCNKKERTWQQTEYEKHRRGEVSKTKNKALPLFVA